MIRIGARVDVTVHDNFLSSVKKAIKYLQVGPL
jgi:hypothetical protein